MLQSLTPGDGALLIWIQQHVVHASWTPVVQFITHLGDSGWIWIALILLMLCFKKTRRAGFIAMVALIVSFAINNLWLKNWVARVRPYEAFEQVRLLVERQHDYSFPSGHSAASFVTAVTMARELPRRYGVPALVLAFAIALSRLYVGVHYPLDVLCGAVSGTLIALVVTWAADRWIKGREGISHGSYR